jgi:hypothetical protein
MSRPIGLSSDPARAGIWRVKAGSPVADDSATLTDANITPTVSSTTGGAIAFYGLDSILVAVEFVGGTDPAAELDVLFRDEDASDGSRWKRAGAAVTLSADFQEVQVFGSKVFPRLQDITGTPTQVTLVIKPGAYQRGCAPFV